MKVFRFLHTGLALILILMGLKMITTAYFKVPTLVMLGVVAAVLTVSIVAFTAVSRPRETDAGLTLRLGAEALLRSRSIQILNFSLSHRVLKKFLVIVRGIVRAIVRPATFLAGQRSANHQRSSEMEIRSLP